MILKFFLNLSRKEQKKRFLRRLDLPEKNWKFSLGDLKERGHWDEYMEAYEDTIRNTATKHAPWVVVPADDKKFARIVVAAAIIDALDRLNLDFPKVDAQQKTELEIGRRTLEQEPHRKKRSQKKRQDAKR